MYGDADLAAIGSLIGDQTRATFLAALGDGRALPAGELARRARVSPSTASSHLARPVAGGLLTVVERGRHRYYRLSGWQAAHLLETMAHLAPPRTVSSLRSSEAATALRRARTCYDHLAGILGVALTESLVREDLLAPSDTGYDVTADGVRAFDGLGIDLDALRQHRRPLARRCLDWSERRPHLAGALGAALTQRLFDLGWLDRISASRAVRLTTAGEVGLGEAFGLVIAHQGDAPS